MIGFDQYGNYIILPTKDMFPLNNYGILVFSSNGSMIARYDYNWQNSNITLAYLNVMGQHGFNFNIVASRSDHILNTILINQTVTDGPISYLFISGNGTAFTKTGEQYGSWIAVSDNDELLFNQRVNGTTDKDAFFFVSYSN